ncbi:hypothetical protein [Sporisorium scitamineum]|uniref:RlpA-like protein double-psi beta-barrel domain-containing protein n=1 Tax=Sporisorium scitamineum TaxID=49012 RepID=A0A0F7S4X2_9BASI|nr:hypothetical protein [Sporisorium scitamineum]
MTVAQAAQPTISHNAAVRRHVAMLEARPARRSVAVGDGKMVQKRQTAEQLAQAAALKKWDDDFHAKNAEWQKAATAALAQGKTPPTYDQYWDGKSGDSSSSSEASSQNNSGPESDECAEQDSGSDATPASTSSSVPSATSDKGAAAAAAATGSKSNAAQSNANASSSSSSSQATAGHFDGQATYYAPGLGACGWTNTDSDYIVAISASLFDSFGTGNPNKNPACGRKISASYGGKTITVSVADRCVGCAWGDLDFTPTGFSQLADMSKGRLDGLKWSWIGSAP